jgi:DNA-binding MarR family transcriptional regulator
MPALKKVVSEQRISKRGERRDAGRAPPAIGKTVSAPTLLVQGSDAQFRELINGLFTLTARIELVRDQLARRIAVTGPQYSLLMAVGQLGGGEGISVGQVARTLHVTSAFVAAESNRLAKANLVEKKTDSKDRRSVLLRLSPIGLARLADLGSQIRGANDQIFGELSGPEFDLLARLVSGLVRNASVALHHMKTPSEGASPR